MQISLRWKLIFVLITLGVSIYLLVPTYRYYVRTEEELLKLEPEELKKLKDYAIRLGLDLQGGMHLVYEIDETKIPKEEVEEALNRAYTIISNRIDQFGVAEPVIQKMGDKRLIIELPGIREPKRAKELIGKTARLEFRLVEEDNITQDVITKIDAAYRTIIEKESDTAVTRDTVKKDTLAQDFVKSDTIKEDTGKPGLFEEEKEEKEEVAEIPTYPLSGYITDGITAEEQPRVEKIISHPEIQRLIPVDDTFLFGKEELNKAGQKVRMLWLVKKRAEMTGASIKKALPDVYQGPKAELSGFWVVNLQFDSKGAKKFAEVTGANVGRPLAIVLDGIVQSAPRIQERIGGGRAQIEGRFDSESAKDLSIVLQAGALPADLIQQEERTIGPTLGRDFVRLGAIAVLISFLVVMVFMIIYYKGAGIIADFALLIAFLYIFAALAYLKATLTLPGIAGLILTIGMAVDANVLIYERIKEELRIGRAVKPAIESGYKNATRTILDSNLTTLITAIILYTLGTGPIKGFAITLSFGIVASMFTAIVVTRLVFDMILHKRIVHKLSI